MSHPERQTRSADHLLKAGRQDLVNTKFYFQCRTTVRCNVECTCDAIAFPGVAGIVDLAVLVNKIAFDSSLAVSDLRLVSLGVRRKPRCQEVAELACISSNCEGLKLGKDLECGRGPSSGLYCSRL